MASSVTALAEDCRGLSDQDLADLREAVIGLEQSALAARLASAVGQPIEVLIEKLPASAEAIIKDAVNVALNKAADVALRSLGSGDEGLTGWNWLDLALSSEWLAKCAAVATGAGGGAGGLAGTVIELPITTTLMVRSIAQIGLLAGEQATEPNFKLECLAVLAMGGRTPRDDSTDVGYVAVRVAMADILEKAAGKSLSEVLPRVLLLIAQRFSFPVAMKLSAQIAPVIGGVLGAALNYVFLDHFQDKARAHFTVRRLERKHGRNQIMACYQAIAEELKRTGALNGVA